MLNLPFEVSGEVKASYRAPLAYGQVRIAKVCNSYIGIHKNFLNGKLGMSLYITDIFNSNRIISSICLANRKATLTEKEYEDMRKIGISLSYTFSGR